MRLKSFVASIAMLAGIASTPFLHAQSVGTLTCSGYDPVSVTVNGFKLVPNADSGKPEGFKLIIQIAPSQFSTFQTPALNHLMLDSCSLSDSRTGYGYAFDLRAESVAAVDMSTNATPYTEVTFTTKAVSVTGGPGFPNPGQGPGQASQS